MFGNLAEMAKLMGKAKEIQAGMKKFKEDMPNAEYSATNSNGSVKVTVSGDFRIKNVEITENASVNPVILSQDFTEAANTALNMAKLAAQQKMAEMTGGLGIDLPMF
ncbi:MAG: YbaB/EbfC family nucleoid-associated protein [Lentisphaeria bacterium]|nr:YbaB/EbfC family nucleoid-associated protein [Lentisphaeria bacterium]MBQ9775778.1 YbaB/EbfC family nucleoid-associated protein [Lentisphaeria bacterium]